jgi:hypothetical protein
MGNESRYHRTKANIYSIECRSGGESSGCSGVSGRRSQKAEWAKQIEPKSLKVAEGQKSLENIAECGRRQLGDGRRQEDELMGNESQYH